MTDASADQDVIMADGSTTRTAPPEAAGKPPRRRLRRAGRAGLSLIVMLSLLALVLGVTVLALTGQPIRLPVWVVAEVEARGNAALSREMPGAALSVGAVEIRIDEGWAPRIRIEDLRLLQGQGATLLALPDVRLDFDAASLLSEATLRPRHLRIVGASVALHRTAEGLLDLRLGTSTSAPEIRSLADALAAVDRVLATPFLSRLRVAEAEASSLTLDDAMTGRVWSVGDGRMRLDIAETRLSAELGLSLVGGGEAPAQAVVTLVRPRDETRLRVNAAIDQVAARDIAAQAPILSWLGVLSAPISGRISAEISAGGLEGLEAEMAFGKGALQPEPSAVPVAFDGATLRLAYDPTRGRINLGAVSVESQSLRLTAKGHIYPLDGEDRILTGPLGQRLPEGFLGQIAISEALIDPEGLFERPLVFTAGAMDARLRLKPFTLDIGQVALVEERGRRLSLAGHAAIAPEGWDVAMDLGLDAIAHDRLLQLWPRSLVPKTRDWLRNNVAEGLLRDVKAALRIAPGQEPRVALGYDFDKAEIRLLPTLPPVRGGAGRSSLEGRSYLIVLDRGEVEAPLGGAIDVAGSAFRVVDVTEKPARADIRLKTDSSITAALSLLDLHPFQFMKKAGRPTDLAEGRAIVDTRLTLPLQRRVQLQDVAYRVEGRLLEVSSDRLIDGKTVTAPALSLVADPAGLTISGPGRVGAAEFDVAFHQGFGPEARGRASLEGRITLTPESLAAFDIALPAGMVSGRGEGDVRLDLEKGAAGRLRLTSDLAGLGLRLDPVGWSKPASDRGLLEVTAELGRPPQISRLALTAPGLSVDGAVTLQPGGGLAEARFTEVALSDWFAGPVILTGRGEGRAPDVAVTGGQIDLRRFKAPSGSSSGASDPGALRLSLDRLVVTDEIALIGLQGDFGQRGGFNGGFRGSLNGETPVSGTIVPSRHGAAVRLQSADAGAALRAAGIFPSARGGTLDLRLTPLPDPGRYVGRAEIRNVRARKTNALAELISAVSIVGLLEQLNGTGILFSTAEFDFVLTPEGVQITDGSAVGASVGLSLSGIYSAATKALALQGVLSPVYLVNGVGAALTRRGEGLFGFNFEIRGTSDNPDVQVNPLSILTPGMFREIFRRPAPVLERQGG